LSFLVTFPLSSTQNHRSPSLAALGAPSLQSVFQRGIDLVVQLEVAESKPFE